MINDIIQLLGITSPQLSVAWTLKGLDMPTTDVTINDLSLTCDGDDAWLAPLSGIWITVGNATFEHVQLPDGSGTFSGRVLKLAPEVHNRLSQLYARLVEGDTTAPFRVQRPVPAYFVYRGTEAETSPPPDGFVLARDPLHLRGELSIHDHEGLPIDPASVAAIFDLFVQRFATLEAKNFNLDPDPPTPPISDNRQLTHLAGLGSAGTFVHIVDLFGQNLVPESEEFPFENLTAVNATLGLHRLTNPANPANRRASAPASCKITAGSFGLLDDKFSRPTLAAGVTLHRDFFRAKTVELSEHLTGIVLPASDADPLPAGSPVVREGEAVAFQTDGNACLSEIRAIFDGAPSTALLVSPVIRSDFELPPTPDGTDENALWPNFPPPANDAPLPTEMPPIPAGLRDSITATAHFIEDAATENTDVLLRLESADFPEDFFIRVYPRRFNFEDGRQFRADGVGALVIGGGAVFRLSDPFRLRKPFLTTIVDRVFELSVDSVIVNRGRLSDNSLLVRHLGEISTNVAPAPRALTPAENNALLVGSNTFNDIPERGICSAGILGLGKEGGSNFHPIVGEIVDYVGAFSGESQPRQAPRYPAQSRNETIAAARQAAGWAAHLSGTWLTAAARHNFSRHGNPGNPGGLDFAPTGMTTRNGLLAFDLARAAFRRTRNLPERLLQLADKSDWSIPSAPTAGTGNTFAGAVLQTIAKGCESPAIALLGNSIPLPDTLMEAASDLSSTVTPTWVPSSMATGIKNALTGLATPQREEAFREFKREFETARNGRRDAFHAMKYILSKAKHLIFLQGTFFDHTAYGDSEAEDLYETLKTRLSGNSGLKLILALSKETPFGAGYEPFAARSYKRRLDMVKGLLPELQLPKQVIAFHPIGTYSRGKRLLTQTVIVDDVWLMLGANSFRRRGFHFDGSTDVVLLDQQLHLGKSLSIKNLRVQLMSDHLALQSNFPHIPHASRVRLADMDEAFFVFRELLDAGGAGLIQPMWEGNLTKIPASAFPTDDVADPEDSRLSFLDTMLTAYLGSLSTNLPG